MDQKPIREAAAGITLARNPNCDDVTVDEKVTERYRADGTAESQDEAYCKILTDNGKRNNQILSLDIQLPYFTSQVILLEVIKPDGQVAPVNVAANSEESIDSGQMRANIYDPNSRVLRVSIPRLEIGDMVHSVTGLTTRRALIPGEFSDQAVFEGHSYIRHLSYEIRSPASLPLKRIFLRDEIPGTVVETVAPSTAPGDRGTIVHHWEVNHVPRMYDEPAMPPYGMVLQRLLVSTMPDWQAVSRWYWGLSRPHLDATSPEMRKTVEELTAGAKTEREKIQALFHYVSVNVRYMGITPEKDRPGFEPHDVRLTFDKRYGVCRDKAALLVSMLRMAGLPAYPVLINVGSKLDPQVPNPSFNHAIVAVASPQGGYVLMDPTDEHTRGLLPAYDDDRSYLVCRPDGDDLRVSLVSPPSTNMMRISTSAVLSANGALAATSELSFDGINDDEYRGAFASMKPDDRRRFFESRLQRVAPGARLQSLEISPKNILDTSVPLRARIAFSAGAMAAFGGGTSIVSVPWIGQGFGLLNYDLSDTGLAKRKYPMIIDSTCGLREEISIKLASDFTAAVSLPPPSSVNEDGVGYRRRFAFKDGTLTGSQLLELKTVEFGPESYLGLKRILAGIGRDEREAPVMAVAGNPSAKPAEAADHATERPVDSNSILLYDRQELTVKDAHTAVLEVSYAKRILSYEGKIRESDVKIPYNPATESVRLIRAVVISGNGRRREISPDEINTMDAGWNASAKRYTGDKILVASLPGTEIGSTIEVAYQITLRGRPYLSGYQAFQLPDMLERKSFRITAPIGLEIQSRVSGPAGIVREKTWTAGGARVFDWQAKDVMPLPNEAGLPPEWTYRAGVSFFVGDAADYLKALNAAMITRADHGANAASWARELTRRSKTRLEALKTIRDAIATSIRPTEPALRELPLSELSDADTTLADGYGHSADRAILTYAMLKAAGFQPNFVLASNLPPIAEVSNFAIAFPLPGDFQDPLVRVTVAGQAYFLNDTDQYARLGSTSHDHKLAIALSTRSCETVKAAPDCESRVATGYSISLADNGRATIGIERRFYGMAFERENRRYAEMPPEEKARFFQEAVSNVAQGARPVGGLTAHFDAYPGVERFAVDVDRYGIADGKFLYFSLPFTPELLVPGTDRRTLPLFVADDFTSTIRAEIKLPPDYRHVEIAPGNETFHEPDGAGDARIATRTENGDTVVTYRLDRRSAIIPPEDYPAALKIESALENKAGRVMLLESDGRPMAGGGGAPPQIAHPG